MSDYLRNRFRHPNYLEVHPEARRIIFFNAHDARGIEFYNPGNNYCMDLLFPGISILCLCNPEWRLCIGSRRLQISLTTYQSDSFEYYLRRIRSRDGSNFEYFRVEKYDHPLSSDYACISQVRPFIHNDRSAFSEGYRPYCPLAIRHLSSDNLRIMQTLFYTRHDRLATCVNKNPLATHWIDC
jgi:hypothetical protein